MQTTYISHKKDLKFYFMAGLSELPNNTGRIVEIAEKIHDYIESGLITITGELKFEWQYQMRWAKTNLKENGLIEKSHKVGSKQYWKIPSHLVASKMSSK